MNRENNETGYCGAGKDLTVARAALHEWEEPCISGANGSGTVFFSYCSLKCVFCQNNAISRGRTGKSITEERLTEIFFELKAKGAHNINLVTPTHYIPPVVRAVKAAKERGLNIPVVYNTSSYETVEAVKLLKDTVDIYLADAKFFSRELSQKYCGAPDYFETCMAAMKAMYENTGAVVSDGDGMLQRGVVLRLLLLPGQLNDAKSILKHTFEAFGNNVVYSLMNQYTPCGELNDFPELQDRVTEDEYERLVDYALELGIENGFIQEGGAAEESFIPCFDGEGV